MSFASYKSPFDEALSKPLIADDNDTPSVTKNTNNNHTNGNNNNDSSAVYSKKLSGLNPNHSTIPPNESFSKFNNNKNKNNNNINPFDTNTNPFEESYQPPNLLHETHTMTTTTTTTSQNNSLEIALLRERNEESKNILTQMNTISAISNEIQSLISNQQETIDDVETNAYTVHDAAERGMNELVSANDVMKNNNGSGVEVFWKYFFGVIGIGGLIISFVIFLHSF
jgi:hypothetical protein